MLKLLLKVILTLLLAQQSCAGGTFEILTDLQGLSYRTCILSIILYCHVYFPPQFTPLYKKGLWNETCMRWWACDKERGICQWRKGLWYLSAWQDVGVGLYPRNNLTQDDPICKHVHLQRQELQSYFYCSGDCVYQLLLQYLKICTLCWTWY